MKNESRILCPHCGAFNFATDSVCLGCGKKVRSAPTLGAIPDARTVAAAAPDETPPSPLRLVLGAAGGIGFVLLTWGYLRLDSASRYFLAPLAIVIACTVL